MIPAHILGIDNGAALLAIVTLTLIALWWRTESSLRHDRVSERKARKMWDESEAKR